MKFFALLLHVVIIDSALASTGNCKAKNPSTCCNICQNGKLKSSAQICTNMQYTVGDVDTDDPSEARWCGINQREALELNCCDYSPNGFDYGAVKVLNEHCDICASSTNRYVSFKRFEDDRKPSGGPTIIGIKGNSLSVPTRKTCTSWDFAGSGFLSDGQCDEVTTRVGAFCCDNGPSPSEDVGTCSVKRSDLKCKEVTAKVSTAFGAFCCDNGPNPSGNPGGGDGGGEHSHTPHSHSPHSHNPHAHTPHIHTASPGGKKGGSRISDGYGGSAGQVTRANVVTAAPVAVAAPTSGNAASTASTGLVASVVALFSMVTLLSPE